MVTSSSMHYIEIPEPGEADMLRLAQMPTPSPKVGEILIRVLAAGVNRPDIMQRQGKYPPPKDASPVLGLEVAGEIAAVGEGVSHYQTGDKVCALTNGGGYAEYTVAPAVQTLPWPKGFDAIHAAALPENYFTVWANVFQLGRFSKGESLLVHGGSSGIGLTAIQLAKTFGGTVYATAGSEEKCAACVKYGADALINYREEHFAERIAALTHNRGVDVILDMVGAAYTQANLDSLAKDGRLVQIATQKGAKTEIDLRQIMSKRLAIIGSTLRPRSTAEKGRIASELHEQVWPLLEQGLCKPVIYQTFPLAQVAEAHKLMESSKHIGKIVLVVE